MIKLAKVLNERQMTLNDLIKLIEADVEQSGKTLNKDEFCQSVKNFDRRLVVKDIQSILKCLINDESLFFSPLVYKLLNKSDSSTNRLKSPVKSSNKSIQTDYKTAKSTFAPKTTSPNVNKSNMNSQYSVREPEPVIYHNYKVDQWLNNTSADNTKITTTTTTTNDNKSLYSMSKTPKSVIAKQNNTIIKRNVYSNTKSNTLPKQLTNSSIKKRLIIGDNNGPILDNLN
jgi:hypothetical protein